MMNTAMTNNLKIDNYENVLVDDWGDGDDIYIIQGGFFNWSARSSVPK